MDMMKKRKALATAQQKAACEKGMVPGARVRRKGVKQGSPVYNDVGIILGFNTVLTGDFPAHQFPLIVEFERGVFQFGVNDVVVADIPSHPLPIRNPQVGL